MEIEGLKDVVGYEGLYKISPSGDVYNAQNGKARKAYVNRDGYIKHSYSVLGRKMAAPLRAIYDSKMKKVIRDDGVVYPSICQAAKENGTYTASLSQTLRRYPERKYNGHNFSFYKENQ